MKKFAVFMFLTAFFVTGCQQKHHAPRSHKPVKPAASQQEQAKKTPATASATGNESQTNTYPKRPVKLYGMSEMNLTPRERKIMEMLGSAAKGRQALGAILAMDKEAARRLLKKALRWDNPNGRIQAAVIASKLKDPGKEVLALMTQNLLHDPDPDCRSETAAAFVDVHYRLAGPYLIRMLQHDPHPMARANAAWALGAMRYQDALVFLVTALDSPHTWVRLRAASALKKLANPKAIHGIRAHLRTEKNPLVKKRLRQALAACTRHR